MRRLSPAQIYMLARLAKYDTVSFEVLRTWDQRPLGGLHRRGMFDLDSALNGHITEYGLEIWEASRFPQLRKNTSARLFKK